MQTRASGLEPTQGSCIGAAMHSRLLQSLAVSSRRHWADLANGLVGGLHFAVPRQVSNVESWTSSVRHCGCTPSPPRATFFSWRRLRSLRRQPSPERLWILLWFVWASRPSFLAVPLLLAPPALDPDLHPLKMPGCRWRRALVCARFV